MIKVTIIGVAFYPEYLKSFHMGIEKLRALLHGYGAACDVIFVSNKSGLAPLDCATSISHNNRGLEFGAFQRGLEAAQTMSTSAGGQAFAFVNDTFNTHHIVRLSQLDRFAQSLIWCAGEVKHPVIIGPIDSINRSFDILGHRTHRWVSTNCFGMNAAAVVALGEELYVPSLDALIVEAAKEKDFFSPFVDPVLKSHLSRWLFSSETESHWYKAGKLDATTSNMFARKARSILQEKFISARLETSSAEFINTRACSLGADWRLKKTFSRLIRQVSRTVHLRRFF